MRVRRSGRCPRAHSLSPPLGLEVEEPALLDDARLPGALLDGGGAARLAHQRVQLGLVLGLVAAGGPARQLGGLAGRAAGRRAGGQEARELRRQRPAPARGRLGGARVRALERLLPGLGLAPLPGRLPRRAGRQELQRALQVPQDQLQEPLRPHGLPQRGQARLRQQRVVAQLLSDPIALRNIFQNFNSSLRRLFIFNKTILE